MRQLMMPPEGNAQQPESQVVDARAQLLLLARRPDGAFVAFEDLQPRHTRHDMPASME